jgi:hypothetical protein
MEVEEITAWLLVIEEVKLDQDLEEWLLSPEDKGLMLDTRTGADLARTDAELLGAGNSNPNRSYQLHKDRAIGNS